jgi:hypothetical protein
LASTGVTAQRPLVRSTLVQTVKSSIQVARAYKIRLMHLVDALVRQLRILLPAPLIAASAPMRQPFALDNAVNRALAGQWRHAQSFQFPGNRLRAAKQPLIVKVQPSQLDAPSLRGLAGRLGQPQSALADFSPPPPFRGGVP